VVGTVVTTGQDLALEPIAFLKGPASSEPIRFADEDLGCLDAGDLAVVYFLRLKEPPDMRLTKAYLLRDPQTETGGKVPASELDVVQKIRALTGQYAVPAASEDDGAGIDWSHTIVPMGVVLLIVFGIGLVLMRVWHRIDPT